MTAPLDLDAIERDLGSEPLMVREHAIGLLAEVRRLREAAGKAVAAHQAHAAKLRAGIERLELPDLTNEVAELHEALRALAEVTRGR